MRQSLRGSSQRVKPKPHTRDWQVSVSGLRFYSPRVGRWVSRDPFLEVGSIGVKMARASQHRWHAIHWLCVIYRQGNSMSWGLQIAVSSRMS